MKPPSIHRGATREQQILVEEAEARGFDLGREIGGDERQQMVAEYFERTGRPELAGEIRALKLVEKG